MDTLVLTSNSFPHARVRWHKALKLLLKGKAEVVEEYPDRYITFAIKMPAVVRLLRAITRTSRGVKFSRENVYMRDKGKCQYCGLRVPRDEFSYDHVMPRAQGGKTSWDNVVVCCTPCNQRKRNRTPEEAGMRLLSRPTKPKKLPDAFRMTLTWRPGMPDAWRTWLRDVAYWHGELEE